MARPRKQTYTMEMYLRKMKNGDIDNSADTQRNFVWKPEQINGLMRTVLLDDYIPPIILAEEDNTRLHIADGGQRSAALNLFRYGNYKITSTIEDSIIYYKKKVKQDDGSYVFEDAECNIKGKTYETLPTELQKIFDEYQLETVIHEHCDSEKTAKYIKIYNQQVSMNASQKAYTYIYNFACYINKIVDNEFFITSSCFTNNEKNNASVERAVMETVMCMFHFDKWNKNTKKIAQFLNENASKDEFNVLNSNLTRLCSIITDQTKTLFNSKDCFIWLTLFNKFTKYGMDDTEFGKFLEAFVDGLRQKEVYGKFFDSADSTGSTKDKSVIITKLRILETLMKDFLHIEEVKPLADDEFISEVVGISIDEVKEDMQLYVDTLIGLEESTIRLESKLLQDENRKSMLAMVAYSYKNDIDLDEWMRIYATNNNTYFIDQRRNFEHMKKDLKNYMAKKENVA